MKFIPVRCELHGWLLLNREFVQPRENHVIKCEGHMITRNTRGVLLIETTEQPPKTRGLTDNDVMEFFGPINPDGYNFLDYCEACKENRSVSCSRMAAQTDEPVTVIAIVCGHTWTLSAAKTQKVREQINAAA